MRRVGDGRHQPGGGILSSQRNAPGGRHEGLIAICLVALLGLVAAAVAGTLPRNVRVPVAASCNAHYARRRAERLFAGGGDMGLNACRAQSLPA